jgi:sulfide dehydrogenase cytochrome subunit
MNRKLIELLGLCSVAFMLNTAPALAADVEDIAKSCADCHGKDGASKESDVPTISGASFYYFNDAMIAYQNEERPCPEIKYKAGDSKGDTTTMCKVAKDLDEEEIEKIAKYYSKKPFVRARQKFDAALAKKGEPIHDEYCEKCHAGDGSSPDDDSGILAGQWMPYLREAFQHYTKGERPMVKKMKPKYEKLSEEDKEALLHFYASFQ